MDNAQTIDGEWIITKYVTKNGKRIYAKNGKHFRFFVPREKVRLAE